MDKDDDILDEFEMTLVQTTKKTRDPEASRRQKIMQQLLNELQDINDVIEKQDTSYPFSSLEVIIEEVTPCSSTQQLENNLSAIKAGLRTRALEQEQDLDLESAFDSDETEFVQSKNLLKDPRSSVYSIKKRSQKNKIEYNSDESSSSDRNGSSFNDSNTSNIDGCNGDSYKDFDSKELTRNKRKSKQNLGSSSQIDSDRNSEYTESKENSYRDKFINNDDRYVRNDYHKRHQFLSLNRNYESQRNPKRNRQHSTSTVNPQTKFSEKENNSPCSWAVKAPGNSNNNKQKYCGDVSFTCLNTYAIKTSPNKFSQLDYNKCSVEELEKRLKHFEEEVQNIQEEYLSSDSYRYEPQNEFSSFEEDAADSPDSKLNNSFSLDRGDNKSLNNRSNSIEQMFVKMGHNETSCNGSVRSFKDNKSSENNYSDGCFEADSEVEEPTYSGTLIVVKKSSKETTCDSGLHTRSSRNKNVSESYYSNDEIIYENQETFPKFIYPILKKDTCTQITETDWEIISEARTDRSENKNIKLNLPNSSDDENLDYSTSVGKSRVLFNSTTTIIHTSYSNSSCNENNHNSFHQIEEAAGIDDLTESEGVCSCFKCFKKYLCIC